MELGYALIKEQLFFRKELIERVYWFIRLRWFAFGTALIASWATYLFFERTLPLLPISIILFCLALYNTIFLLIWRRLKTYKPLEVKTFAIFTHVQMGLDLLTLFFIIYFTGGIYSPFLIFVIFHIILAGILLAPLSCFIYGITVLLAIGALILMQKTTALPFQPALFQSPLFPSSIDFPHILLPYLIFSAAILITAFLVTTVKLSLRMKGKELLSVSKELDLSNEKLTALYEMVKEMGLCSDLQALMDSATRNATRIMGVKGCSVKLLDDEKKTLRFTSTYGLSQDYIAKGSISIEKSPINRQILEGSIYTIAKIHEKDYFQYPEDIRKEGIPSMMCLPFRVEKKIFGIFCVYSEDPSYFGQSDIDFFSLMTDLTAIAMENLRSGLTKLWFMMKASHQLRSPLNTIYSMLKPITDGYLGPIDERQKETIVKCLKRIRTLGDLINDLLKLGEKKNEISRPTLYPVDLVELMNQITDFYKTQATEKGLDIRFHKHDPIPKVLANEKMIDELFANLISNAIKYTPQGGKVDVTLTDEGKDRIRFEVSDTGIGIAEEEIPKLFTEFYRTETAKALVEEGTGLGLAIVKEIIDRLGGTIHVESLLGRGTRFSCLIPSLSLS